MNNGSNQNNSKLDGAYSQFLDKVVKVKIERPLNSPHPKYGFKYELNYGFVSDTEAPDGEEIGVYVIGVNKPLKEFEGECIAVIHRLDDEDDKLIVVPEGLNVSDEEITKSTHFQERYFKSIIIRASSMPK